LSDAFNALPESFEQLILEALAYQTAFIILEVALIRGTLVTAGKNLLNRSEIPLVVMHISEIFFFIGARRISELSTSINRKQFP